MSKSSGMFTRLVAGDLPQKGKRWPSDTSGESRLFLISGCTGEFTTTSKKFDVESKLPEGHAEKEAVLKAAARAKLAEFAKQQN